MKIVERQLRTWTPDADRRKRYADVTDGIDDDLAIRDADTGRITVIQKKLDLDSVINVKRLTQHLRLRGFFSAPADNTLGSRASGIKASEQWFGWVPPDELRRRYAANRSHLYDRNPELAAMIEHISPFLWEQVRTIAPEQADLHEGLVAESVHRDWWINGTPFTSGIINNSNVLPYHKDGGNLTGTWSMMLCLRNGIGGGQLHLPEYDFTLGIPNASVMFFNGQAYWHGVTPFTDVDQRAYRFTLVWYVKQRMSRCGSREDELRRAANHATTAMSYVNPKREGR